MKKFILIPDSFKGTMSSSEICDIMSLSIKKTYADAQVIAIPVADGGEGSVDAFLCAVGGEKKVLTVNGPFFNPVSAFYGIIDGGTTAIIEMAACAGLPLAGDQKDPCKTTTYGVGQLMQAAINDGCKKIILGLGGSATNDIGAGAAAALGVKFMDDAGKAFIPTGGTLCDVAHIDISGIAQAVKDVEIVTMCDIDNPLYGENGAAYIFGPQKGADAAMVKTLDAGLKHMAHIIKADLKQDVSQQKGAGAAGGMGCGMVSFLGSRLQMGIETVLETVKFDTLLNDVSMVFSGEGKIDSQSMRGKVVIGVARHTKKAGIPLVAIVGDIDDHIEAVYDEGVSAVFSINRVAVEYKNAKPRAKSDLSLTMDNLMGFIKTIEKA